MHLWIYGSIYLFLYTSICISISLFMHLYLCYVFISLNIYLSFYVCIYESMYVSINLCIFLYVNLSIYLPLDLSIHLFFLWLLYLSMYRRSIYLYVMLKWIWSGQNLTFNMISYYTKLNFYPNHMNLDISTYSIKKIHIYEINCNQKCLKVG